MKDHDNLPALGANKWPIFCAVKLSFSGRARRTQVQQVWTA
jgi:hypothetical protein